MDVMMQQSLNQSEYLKVLQETFEQFRRDVTQYLTEKDMLRIVPHGIRTGKRL